MDVEQAIAVCKASSLDRRCKPAWRHCTTRRPAETIFEGSRSCKVSLVNSSELRMMEKSWNYTSMARPRR